MRRARDGVMFTDIVRRLLAHSVYHRQSPSPLADVLFDPPGYFAVEHGMSILFRPELTPAIRRLFAHRLEDAEGDTAFLKRAGMTRPSDEEWVPPFPLDHPPSALYRFKVALGWNKRVWRVIELLDNQTLEEFHNIIQEAFDWDDDHLYAFYVSNRTNDWVTSISRPIDFEYDPPHSDEVTLKMLDLKTGQHLQYVFDFGDHLDHDIELMHIGKLPPEGTFPRIVLSRGEAPAQYPSIKDEDEWDEHAP